jgi:hypothetical protein
MELLLPYISHFYSSFFWPFNHACMQHSMMSSMRTSSQESGPSFTYTRKKRGEADCFCAILADTRVSSFAWSSLVSLNQTMRHDLDVFSRGRKWRRSLTKSLIASVTRYKSERYIFLKNVWFDLAELPLPTALAIPSNFIIILHGWTEIHLPRAHISAPRLSMQFMDLGQFMALGTECWKVLQILSLISYH